MSVKYYYPESYFPNGFNLDMMQYEIQQSTISTSLDYGLGLGGGASGGVSINFKDTLSNSDKTTLDSIVSGMTSTPFVVPAQIQPISFQSINADSDGFIKTRTQPATAGLRVKLLSNNMCSIGQWASGSVPAAGLSWTDTPNPAFTWAPTAGRKLHVYRTFLVISTDIDPNAKSAVFSGANVVGIDGDSLTNFSRTYSSIWDYREQCDNFFSYTDFSGSWNVFEFVYDSPLVLKNSNNASITLTLSNGIWSGTRGKVILRCISLPE